MTRPTQLGPEIERFAGSARVADLGPDPAGPGFHADDEPGASPSLSSMRSAQVRVAIVAGLVAGAAALLSALLLPHMRPFGAPYHVPWWLVALGFFIADWKVLHVHFRRETHVFTMIEVPVVAGLFLLAPAEYLLAAVTGGGLALLVTGRGSWLKMAYNLALAALIGIVILAIFQLFTDHTPPPSLADWVAAVLATLAAAVLAAILTATVITASGGAPQFHKLPEMIRFGSLIAVANTSLALLAITVMWQDQAAIALVALPLLALFFVYGAYLSEREKHQRLELLYQSSRIMQHSPELDSAIMAVLEHAREMFRAESAEILLFPQPGSSEALRTVARSEGEPEVMVPVAFDPDDPLARRTATEGRAFFPVDPRGATDSQVMLSPLAGDSGIFGMMRVAHRLTAGTSFDTDDLRLLETLANQAAVALENGQLEQSLAELSRLKEQLRFLAYHDPLTSLPNRISMAEEIDARLSTPGAEPPTILYIDLDDFKVVNDSLGHHAGDEILVAASDRIRNCLGPGDVAARLGGDEFAVLLTEGERFDRSTATSAALLRVLRSPFVLNGQEMTIGASIGIATWRAGQTADDLLRDADVAMYAAKTSGKRRIARFDPSMHAALVARHTLSVELARGLERGELEVHYQPIVELASGRITAIEALARWRHPFRGLIAPDEFIAIAEETGSINTLGRIVLVQAAAQVARWTRLPDIAPDLRVSINVSPVELLRGRLRERCPVGPRDRGPRVRPADPGSHRDGHAARHAADDREARRADEDRRRRRRRRLRDRLLVAGLPAPVPRQRPQDRPRVRPAVPLADRRGRLGRREHDHRPRPGDEPAGRRRRHRGGGPARAAPGHGLRVRPGVPLPPAARRSHDRALPAGRRRARRRRLGRHAACPRAGRLRTPRRSPASARGWRRPGGERRRPTWPWPPRRPPDRLRPTARGGPHPTAAAHGRRRMPPGSPVGSRTDVPSATWLTSAGSLL